MSLHNTSQGSDTHVMNRWLLSFLIFILIFLKGCLSTVPVQEYSPPVRVWCYRKILRSEPSCWPSREACNEDEQRHDGESFGACRPFLQGLPRPSWVPSRGSR